MRVVGSASPSGRHTTYESANHIKRWKIMAEATNRRLRLVALLLTRKVSARIYSNDW